ncbi:MAG: hypothetical protein IPM74_03820 [Crocinitomicaceae bacterium]|nr:hypothetical protein [Crocinitomicaceae bacterium]MBK8925041.1 hypothetical protein [Crocinitomicaceae bacterium]
MESLFTNWTMMRWMRLFIGTGFLVAFFIQWDWVLLLIAAYFLIMMFFNVGCGVEGCATPNTKK